MRLKHKFQKMNFEERGFEVLKKMIYKELGLDCTYYRDSYLKRRVNSRMRTKGINSYWKYSKYLRDNPQAVSYTHLTLPTILLV